MTKSAKADWREYETAIIKEMNTNGYNRQLAFEALNLDSKGFNFTQFSAKVSRMKTAGWFNEGYVHNAVGTVNTK